MVREAVRFCRVSFQQYLEFVVVCAQFIGAIVFPRAILQQLHTMKHSTLTIFYWSIFIRRQ